MSVCGKHGNYKGKNVPNNECLTCWEGYFLDEREHTVSGEELAEFCRHLRHILMDESEKTEKSVLREISSRINTDIGEL
jgi:hypothetical protein